MVKWILLKKNLISKFDCWPTVIYLLAENDTLRVLAERERNLQLTG